MEKKMNLNNKNILVTGGAGFIGSNLIKKIQDIYPSASITILDNLFTGSIEAVCDVVESIVDNTFINLNTWEIDDYFNRTKGEFDVVFHFGEYSRVVPSFNDIEYVIKSNMYGTAKVIEMCRKWGAKLIYSASSSGFGNDGEDQNLSPYSWMKAKSVELIKNYAKWFDLDYEICYFFNVYGPGQIMSGDYATVVGIFERQYLNGEKLTVVEPGHQTRDFTHIEDIVDGVLAATKKNMTKEWHLRSGKAISIIELAEMFDTEWDLIPPKRGEREYVDCKKTQTNGLLNWSPKHEIKDYVNSIIDIKHSK